MSSDLDPYTTAAENDNVTPQEKISGLHNILKSAKVGMLTTRSADGSFHSRAMTPTSLHSETQLTLTFLANNASHKFEEIENDSNVNVSFLDQDSTAWASYCGKAKIDKNRESIKKHWSPYVSAYFGDLKDGVHKGDENDPRISVIEVVPEEIRYWLPTKGTIGRAIETGISAMTGRVAAPGQLRTITKAEIQLTQGLHAKTIVTPLLQIGAVVHHDLGRYRVYIYLWRYRLMYIIPRFDHLYVETQSDATIKPLFMAAFISNSALTADNERSRLNRPPDVDSTSLQLIQRAKFMNSCTLVCLLPIEVLSKIFELGQIAERDELQDDHDSDGDDNDVSGHLEVSMSHVSSHFRNVALGTRKLWTSIDIGTRMSKDRVAAYVSRSAGCGLWVHLDFSAKPLTNANERAKLDIILPHVYRYHRLIIDTINEETDNPVIRRFHETGAPILEHLSISVDEAEDAAAAKTGVLVGGADQLSFVRLRGIAMSLFQPPLSMVTTLHLDQTLPLPIHFSTFLHMLSASPFLAHLSVYGDIVGPLAWSGTMSTIDLPNLRSLRICGVSGTIYSNLLLNINAACLNSLVLKDAQEFDLESFWASPNMCKFPQLHHLTFCDFEFSSHVYADVFRAFPAIRRFTTWCSPATPMILSLLARPAEDLDIPWPDLHTLSFLLDCYDDDLIKDVLQNREAAGCPLVRLRLGTSHHPLALRQYHWLQKNVVLERIERLEQWPATDASPDKDDNLFY